MNDKKYIHRKIYADCIRATALPILLYGLQEVLEGLLTVRTAGLLGQFADAVFRLDFAFGQENLWKLLACIAATVLLIPFINVFSNIFMIKYALLHDRMVLGRFLDKEYAAVLACDAGDLQHRLEWEPTDLRCNFVNIVTDLAKVAVTSVYLLYSALAVSPLYTAIVFAVSLVKLTVPIAVLGAFIGLWMTGMDLNMYAQIGLVMLVGLAAKNAILIVEFAVLQMERGQSLLDAAVTAARMRLRPILMTSFAFILGCVPLVMAEGSGALARNSIGIVVVVGMSIATVLGVFFIPCSFVFIMKLFRSRIEKGHHGPDPDEEKAYALLEAQESEA